MRECCRRVRDGEAPMCQPCRDLLGSDLVADMNKSLAEQQAEDDANELDLQAERVGARTRADGGM